MNDADQPVPGGKPARHSAQAGKKVSDIASASGVRITTLRTQLSSILRKVGVDRQADLMRVMRVLSSVPVISSKGTSEET